jgi:biofilm PGA synthesis N-glycosyltransferase PgaC
VNTCFRKSVLHDVGYWSSETVTEDIDISWKLQFRYWDIRYEPNALTWILVPETLQSLWKQRLRWAQGGYEAATKFGKQMFQWKNRRMWLIGLEYWVSVLWCYAVAFTILCFGATYALPKEVMPEALRVESLIPGWTGVALATVCLLQFMVGLVMDSLYERRGQFRYIFWAIWYPAVYWAISAATTVVAVPKALMKKGKTKHARWISPKRYLKYAPLRLRDQQHKEEHRRSFWAIIPKSQRVAEVLIMTISWGLWAYLILPLLSLVVWYFGAVLFKETMLTPGGISTLIEIAHYGAVIFSMWLGLAVWIFWNKLRYSDMRDRRKSKAPVVSDQQLMEYTGLDQFSLTALRECQEMCLHFDDNDKPVIDDTVAKLHARKSA